jgi:hypothetical protein
MTATEHGTACSVVCSAKKLINENVQKKLHKYSKPRSFQGSTGDLKQSLDPSPTFAPLTQNPGSAPVFYYYYILLFLFFVTGQSKNRCSIVSS